MQLYAMASILSWPKHILPNFLTTAALPTKWFVRKIEISLWRKWKLHYQIMHWCENGYKTIYSSVWLNWFKHGGALWLSNRIWVEVLGTISRLDPWNLLYTILHAFFLSLDIMVQCAWSPRVKNHEDSNKRNSDLSITIERMIQAIQKTLYLEFTWMKNELHSHLSLCIFIIRTASTTWAYTKTGNWKCLTAFRHISSTWLWLSDWTTVIRK